MLTDFELSIYLQQAEMHEIAKELNPISICSTKTFTIACCGTCTLLGIVEIKMWNML